MTDKNKLRYVELGLDFHNMGVDRSILKTLIPVVELILRKKGKTDLEDLSKIKKLKDEKDVVRYDELLK